MNSSGSRHMWHVKKTTGVNDQINDGWFPFNCFSAIVKVLYWLTLTCRLVEKNWAIVNNIGDICAFPTFFGQDDCKALIKALTWNNLQGSQSSSLKQDTMCTNAWCRVHKMNMLYVCCSLAWWWSTKNMYRSTKTQLFTVARRGHGEAESRH